MEPQQNEIDSVIAPLKKVTPLSKYLAMLLFSILPFLGGWIGYFHAPEKVVERVVEIEKVIENTKAVETDIDYSSETETIITTSDSNRTPSGQLVKDYKFDNGAYNVSFSFTSSQIAFKDGYDPGSDESFYKLYVYESKKEMSEPLFRFYVHSQSVGILMGTVDGTSLFNEDDGSFQGKGMVVEIKGQQWELLGAYKRCDIGGCDTADYFYTKISDGYRQYILSDISLHQEGEMTDDLSFVLKSLKFDSK